MITGFLMTEDGRQLKRRGPPPTGKGWLLGVRLQPTLLHALDAWIAKQPEVMSRPEAVRKILVSALIERA